MEINPSDYTSVTDRLQIGSFRKIPHKDCSNSNVLRVENTVEGFKFYCFKCHEYTFSSNFNSPAERIRRQAALDEQTKRQVEKDYSLPTDFSHDIPSRGLTWLGRGGWTIELIEKYNIGFSVALNRVILPVVYRSIHRGYTARAIESWQSPKYLELCQQGVMWESHRKNGQSNVAVLCEDILSAGRCGEFIKAYAMLGTTLDTTQLSELMKYDRVLIWLDNDRGGHEGLMKAVPRLRVMSDVRIIRSEVDPKLLSNTEIKELLCPSSRL